MHMHSHICMLLYTSSRVLIFHCTHNAHDSFSGGSYSEVIAEISSRDTVGGEEVECSELADEQTKRKRVYPSAMVSTFIYLYVISSHDLAVLSAKNRG